MSALRYWDSTAFLAWLKPEPHRAELCRSIIREAEKGDIRIVTSAVTLTEVIKLKGSPKLKPDQEKEIYEFFQNDYIIVRNLDRWVAEEARRLIWRYAALQPKDSIHVAAALSARAPFLDTFDEDLLGLDGKLSSQLKIQMPQIPEQYDLELKQADKS